MGCRSVSDVRYVFSRTSVDVNVESERSVHDQRVDIALCGMQECTRKVSHFPKSE